MLEVRVGEVGANLVKLAKFAVVGLVGSDREDGREGQRGRCGGSARARGSGERAGEGAGERETQTGAGENRGKTTGKNGDPVCLWAAGGGSLTPPPPWEPTAASPGFPVAHRAPLLSPRQADAAAPRDPCWTAPAGTRRD